MRFSDLYVDRCGHNELMLPMQPYFFAVPDLTFQFDVDPDPSVLQKLSAQFILTVRHRSWGWRRSFILSPVVLVGFLNSYRN